MKKNHNSLIIIILLITSVIFTACKKNNAITQTPEKKAKQQENVPMTPALLPLPDTAYASVEQLEFKVDIFDSTRSSDISDLHNLYASAPGILTFRGGPYRDAQFHGSVKGRPDSIAVDWKFRTAYDGRKTAFGVWGGGTGWTGQPLYVCWPDSCIKKFEQHSPALLPAFSKEEIIVGSLAGKVYFIDFQTGDSSRRTIDVKNTIKGTPSLDPTLNGNLYVGQGIPIVHPFGALTINLYSHQRTQDFPTDPNAWRNWHAYDASPIRIGEFLFRVGENGTIYKYSCTAEGLKLHSTLRYRVKGKGAPGMEASMAVYLNYGYVADNHGNIVCINLNTLKPVWHYDNHDDTDSSPVLEVENGVPYLYNGCEVDRQGDSGICHIVKLNALNGELAWERKLEAKRAHFNGQTFDGGIFGTPLLGEGNCKELIFFNFVSNIPTMKGDFIALKKSTGEIAYRTPLKWYPWSSPVALMNEQNEMFIFTGDTSGSVYLIDAKSGEIIYTKRIGNNFESSPAVIGNHIVVGSRGQEIFRMSVL